MHLLNGTKPFIDGAFPFYQQIVIPKLFEGLQRISCFWDEGRPALYHVGQLFFSLGDGW